jgi:hypothetical protein
MWPFDPPSDRAPSALWMWGFPAYATGAVAAFILSYVVPAPTDRLLRALAGALLLLGGVHQVHVVAHKRATRWQFSTYGPDSFQVQRQTGWSAMVLGLALIASALLGL